jgi:hypothetical protein
MDPKTSKTCDHGGERGCHLTQRVFELENQNWLYHHKKLIYLELMARWVLTLLTQKMLTRQRVTT